MSRPVLFNHFITLSPHDLNLCVLPLTRLIAQAVVLWLDLFLHLSTLYVWVTAKAPVLLASPELINQPPYYLKIGSHCISMALNFNPFYFWTSPHLCYDAPLLCMCQRDPLSDFQLSLFPQIQFFPSCFIAMIRISCNCKNFYVFSFTK